MTTKNKFDVENPTVVVLSNGRYAYKEKCPWTGKNDKELFAFKFCSATAYEEATVLVRIAHTRTTTLTII